MCVCDYTVQTPGTILRGHKVDECIAQVGAKLDVSWEVKEVIPQGRARVNTWYLVYGHL